MRQSTSLNSFGLLVLLAGTCGLSGCAASLGPGYLVKRQNVILLFLPQPPGVRVSAEFYLKNVGNQPLDSIEVRLPGRRFHPQDLQTLWDGSPSLLKAASPDNLRDTLLHLPSPWNIGESHTLAISYEIAPSPAADSAIPFSSDAFYLPAESWAPELPQVRGLFGFGGTPPAKWDFTVRVPRDFLVHASGTLKKRFRRGQEAEFRFVQSRQDLNPFVVAGRYHQAQKQIAENRRVYFWSRGNPGAVFRPSVEALSRAIQTYDSLFGSRDSRHSSLWIVECPSGSQCGSSTASRYSALLYGPAANPAGELISRDTLFVDSDESQGSLEAEVGPALAAAWLGYGLNPGYYDQQPPMSALPAFAAALAREAVDGPQVRSQIIQRALAQIPPSATPGSNSDPAVIRAKSLLLFFALQDRVGADAFQKALQHMLYARQSRGFDIADLISALEQESRQPVGPFIRHWIKRPGVPQDFRDRFARSDGVQPFLAQEAMQ